MPSHDRLLAEARQIFDSFNSRNGFLLDERQAESTMPSVMASARRWVATVESLLDNITVEILPDMLTWYDAIHRIARSCPADSARCRSLTTRYTRAIADPDRPDDPLTYSAMSRYSHLRHSSPELFTPDTDAISLGILSRWISQPSADSSPRRDILLAASRHHLLPHPYNLQNV